MSASAALAAWILMVGFREPLVADPITTGLLLGSALLLLVSRIALYVPGGGCRERVAGWWPDHLVFLALVAIAALGSVRAALVLAGVYSLLSGVLVAGLRTAGRLIDCPRTGGRSVLGRWTLAAMVVTLLTGSLLSLPVFWAGAVTGQKATQWGRHWSDCVFTSAAALTGTGLSVIDIGNEFNRVGQLAVLALVQLGGLWAVLVGLALVRRWQPASETPPDGGPVSRSGAGLAAWVCLGVLAIEVLGAAGLYGLWDAQRDSNFADATHTPAVLPRLDAEPDGRVVEARLVAGLFHSVSAFCNAGLALPTQSLVRYAGCRSVYAVLLPLMLLGCIGVPVLVELRRRLSPRTARPALSCHARVTLIGLLVVTTLGSSLLLAAESSRRWPWQLRYPRENVPGKLNLGATSTRTAIVFSSDESAQTERLSTMPLRERAVAALFQCVSAFSGGMRTARLDESSLSSAGRLILMACMLVGGGIGGTAGGLRLLTIWVLLRCVFRRRTGSGPEAASVTAAAGVGAGLLLLTGTTALLLVYRDVGSLEASIFEAFSACCNVGFSTGLTRQLAVESRVLLMLAMLIGRVLPLAVLWAAFNSSTNAEELPTSSSSLPVTSSTPAESSC